MCEPGAEDGTVEFKPVGVQARIHLGLFTKVLQHTNSASGVFSPPEQSDCLFSMCGCHNPSVDPASVLSFSFQHTRKKCHQLLLETAMLTHRTVSRREEQRSSALGAMDVGLLKLRVSAGSLYSSGFSDH